MGWQLEYLDYSRAESLDELADSCAPLRLLVPKNDAPLAHGRRRPELAGASDIWLVVFHRAFARTFAAIPIRKGDL